MGAHDRDLLGLYGQVEFHEDLKKTATDCQKKDLSDLSSTCGKMDDFKLRLISEQSELQDKLQKLTGFIGSSRFNKIDDVQRTLLNVQARAMETYNQCLIERLERI